MWDINQREWSFSRPKSNELRDQQDMFCFNHASAFYSTAIKYHTPSMALIHLQGERVFPDHHIMLFDRWGFTTPLSKTVYHAAIWLIDRLDPIDLPNKHKPSKSTTSCFFHTLFFITGIMRGNNKNNVKYIYLSHFMHRHTEALRVIQEYVLYNCLWWLKYQRNRLFS